ncbi:MAG: ugpQ [Bacteroidetes bacterium]|nr:ugpQ [Bacteroidota bacterium]
MNKRYRFFKHLKITPIIIGVFLVLIGFLLIYLNQEPKPSSFIHNEKDIIYFAHRGYIFDAPENSYSSVEKAYNKGFNGIEIDISSTIDDKLVLFHDKALNRMLGINGEINEISFNDLQKHNIIWKRMPTNQKVVELETIFKDFPNMYYYLDIKNPSYKNIQQLYDLILKYKMQSRVIIAHAKLLPHLLLKLQHPMIANALEGFNAGKEKWINYIPKKLRPNFYSSFFYNTSEEQMNFYKEKNLLDKIIVYDITKDNYDKAINEYGLKHLIIDIKEIKKNK